MGPVTAWIVDTHRLSSVNDAYGWEVGDAMLNELGGRLSSAVTEATQADGARLVVGHLGGGDFIVIVDRTDGATISAVSEAIGGIWDVPVQIAGHRLRPWASIGCRTFDHGVDRIETALSDLGLALRRARPAGNAFGIGYFEPDLRVEEVNRRDLRADLPLALEHDEFELHHQPIVDLATRRIVAAECLLRWNHPGRGLLTPEDFLDLAEDTGALADIGRHTIRSTCRRFATLNRSAPWPLSCSLNISTRELLIPDLHDTVAMALKAAGLPPELLTLEISEDLAGDVRSLDVLTRLRSLGVRVAIDDFGTGSSTLSRLTELPVTDLKLDPTFVGAIGINEPRMAIAGAVIDIAAALGLDVTAEGVVTEEQADWLRTRGCRTAQGWLYGRPMSFSRFSRMITSLQLPENRSTIDPIDA